MNTKVDSAQPRVQRLVDKICAGNGLLGDGVSGQCGGSFGHDAMDPDYLVDAEHVDIANGKFMDLPVNLIQNFSKSC